MILAAALASAAVPALAQDPQKSPEQIEIDRIKGEADLAKEQANLVQQRAALAKARVDAVGLPSFSGTTILNGTAGAMEANMLAMYALQAAADGIAGEIKGGGPVLVLAGNETVDLNQVVVMQAEMKSIGRELKAAMAMGSEPAAHAGHGQKGMLETENFISSLGLGDPVSAAVQAATAIGGLLRSETTVSAVDLASVSERSLANAVAGRIPQAYQPAALVGRVDQGQGLLSQLEDLADRRSDAALALAQLDSKAPKAIALTAAIKHFDDFRQKVSTPDEKNIVPVVRAAQLERLFEHQPRIVRVFVDKAGGTFVNTKNLKTFFGADPLRVTGGLVASYTLTDPATGRVEESNIFVCRTSLSRLRQIHDASWMGPALGRGLCTAMAAPGSSRLMAAPLSHTR